MKERPILFSTPMVKAILEGRKTVTRRVIKPQPKYIESSGRWYWDKALDCHGSPLVDASRFWWEYYGTSPYGKAGDILWVRESWNFVDTYPEPDVFGLYLYKANGDSGKMRPSIHMPKVACRLKLEIISITVERLHDITKEDAKREGAPMYVPGHGVITNDDIISDPGYLNYISYKIGFEHLWYEINGKESWEANPWVWRIEFTKIL